VAMGLSSVFAYSLRKNVLCSVPFPLFLSIFLVHFKAGLLVFGTGLAIIPVLEQSVVHGYHWLSSAEFFDGIALGQATPGPVTISSAFIGYRTAGFWGALIAFAGMYLPGLFFILGLLPVIERKVAGARWLQAFERGAVPAVIGCVAAATFLLGRLALVDLSSILLFMVLWGLGRWASVPGWAIIPLGSLVNVGVHSLKG